MRKLILDTSVCIDLHNGNLLQTVLQLPYRFVLSDVIVAELREPDGSLLIDLGYVQESVSGNEMQEVHIMRNLYPAPSLNDLMALVLAKRSSCILLTGDNPLRKAARQERVTAQGVLWLLDELLTHGILSPHQAANALEKIIAEGSWLPKKECEERIRKWRK